MIIIDGKRVLIVTYADVMNWNYNEDIGKIDILIAPEIVKYPGKEKNDVRFIKIHDFRGFVIPHLNKEYEIIYY